MKNKTKTDIQKNKQNKIIRKQKIFIKKYNKKQHMCGLSTHAITLI